MKKVISVILLILAFSCYKKDDNNYNNNPPQNGGGDCGTYNGYQLYKDNEGCYYSGANYSKVYVDASNCKCQ